MPARRVTRRTRLQRGLRSPARRARQEKKRRRQEKFPSRPRAYQEHQVPPGQLAQMFFGAARKFMSRKEDPPPGPRDWSPGSHGR